LVDSRLQWWDPFFSPGTCVKRFKSTPNGVADKKDVRGFRLAIDMIEQFKQIAHFARRTVAITKEW